ncbi:MAG: hypothetical protein RJQ03_02655, partial [Miltoncostaeaceae bacterium]
HDYDPREDTLTRLWPALVLLLLAGLSMALRPEWEWWRHGLAVTAGALVAIAGLAVVNLVRGRRALRRPDDIGFLEAGVFVLTPALASALLGDDWSRTATIAAVSAGVAVALYGLTSGGVLPMLVHQWRPALEGVVDTAAVALRALPPLIAVLLFLAVAGETWRAFGRLEGWRFGALLLGLAGLAAIILIFGLAEERRGLYARDPAGRMAEDARRTPAAPLVARGVDPLWPALTRPERANVAGALLLGLILRVVIVGVAVGLALLAVSVVVMDRALTAEWTGAEPDVLLALNIAGSEVVLTSAAVRVAAALGVFAALYFVAVALAEGRNREEFLDDELARLRRVMAEWSYYRGAIAADQGRERGDETAGEGSG